MAVSNDRVDTIQYLDIFKLSNSFFSLDISKNSLGWVLWYDNVLQYGTYKVVGETLTELKYDFRKFILEKLKDKKIDTLYIEDTIMGNNYKTSSILISLNTIPDDLVYEGLITVGNVCRVGNNTWKKYLKMLIGYEPSMSGLNIKDQIKEMLNILGFTWDVKQDVLDAMGIAIGCIANEKLLNINKSKKLKTDIEKGYVIRQCINAFEQDEKLKAISKRRKHSLEIYRIREEDITKDLRYTFKKIVEENGDNLLFDIRVPAKYIGSLIINKKLEVNSHDAVNLVVYKK